MQVASGGEQQNTAAAESGGRAEEGVVRDSGGSCVWPSLRPVWKKTSVIISVLEWYKGERGAFGRWVEKERKCIPGWPA